MEDLLYQYNPWWEGAADFSVYRPRPAQIERISKHLGQGRAVFLVGMRRAGKTTLLRLLVEKFLADEVQPQHILYISMDDYLLRSQSIIDIVAAYRKVHKLSVDQPAFLLFDEITYKDDFQQQLKNLIDKGNVTIIATASSCSVFRDQKAFLTGRSLTIEIQPLSFAEYLEFKKIHIAQKDLQLLDVYFLDYMREGGLPENIVYPTRDYLMNLADDIIQKDIAAYYGVRDHQLLRDYFTLLMERSGKQVSINKISHILKISPDTSRRYLSYFENAFLIYLAPRWRKTNEQLLAPKKVYACDLGFKYLFIGERDKGSYFENYVYLQLRSKGPVYYYYQDGIELDFLINGDILVECKYNDELKGLQLQAFNDYPAGMKYFVGSVRDLEVLDERVTG